MTKKQLKDLSRLYLKLNLVSMLLVSMFILVYRAAIELLSSEALWLVLGISAFGSTFIFLPIIILETRNRKSDPYRFSRDCVSYYRVRSGLEYFADKAKESRLFIKLPNSNYKYIWNGSEPQLITLSIVARADEEQSILQIISAPESKFKVYGGACTLEALNDFESSLGISECKLDTTPEGKPVL